MKKRNEGWTCYLKTDIGRQVLRFILALSAASLLVAGIALALPSDFTNDANHFLTFNGIDDAKSACKYYQAIGGAIFDDKLNCELVDPKDVNFLRPGTGLFFD